MAADGAAAVEVLRAELARAKEQARLVMLLLKRHRLN